MAVMILLSVILTSMGVYDKFAQWAGAGSAVPVTGFANSMASARLNIRVKVWCSVLAVKCLNWLDRLLYLVQSPPLR